MKFLKILGLAAIAAAALMAFAGSASATILTGEGGKTLGVGTIIHAESEGHAILDSPIGKIECLSTVEGEVTNAGGPEATVVGKITALTFERGGVKCTNGAVVNVLALGTLEIHTEYETIEDPNGEKTSVQKKVSTNNGTLTSTGAEVTVELLGAHCIYRTNGTDLGTVTGSANAKEIEKTHPATLDISANIPRISGRSGALCGSTAPWTGSYKVTKPNPLNVD